MPKVGKIIIGKNGEVERYYWGGKLVSEKVYKARVKAQNVGKNLRNIYGTKSAARNLKSAELPAQNITEAVSTDKVDASKSPFKSIEGRRIIHVKTLARGLICRQCKSVLSLLDIVSEKKSGLASTLFVQCRACKTLNTVETDKKHEAPKQKPHYDVNTKAVMGALDAGMGNTQLNKILEAVNIPPLNWATFKTHEKEINNAMEALSHVSCKKSDPVETSVDDRTLPRKEEAPVS